MIYFVPTPIGNLGDISIRTLEVMRNCQVALCEDTRVSKNLINLLNQRFNANINIKRFIPVHSHNENSFISEVSSDFFNQNILYMSDAGMPCISDPGVFLVRYAQENKIDYEVLPGANAALTALVYSGFSDKEFIFLGFLPNTGAKREIAIQNALNQPYPVIIYESPRRILSLIKHISQIAPQRNLFAIKEISKKFETRFNLNSKDMVCELENANLDGEWCVVISQSPDSANVEKICIDDIMALEIAPKQKAKLISKLTGKSTKEIYSSLSNQYKK